MKILITALIFCILGANPLRAAEKKLYSAANHNGDSNNNTDVEDGGSGQFGVYVRTEGTNAVLIYPIQIADQSTITKMIIYAKNTDKISATQVFDMALGKISKQGLIVEQFNFSVPTGADSTDQKITFDMESGMKINYKKYDYIVLVSLGDVNNLLTDTTSNNDPANAPIFQAFKIVYELA